MVEGCHVGFTRGYLEPEEPLEEAGLVV